MNAESHELTFVDLLLLIFELKKYTFITETNTKTSGGGFYDQVENRDGYSDHIQYKLDLLPSPSSASEEKLSIYSTEQSTLPPPHHPYSVHDIFLSTASEATASSQETSIFTPNMPVSGSLAELKARLCLREQ